MFGRLRSAGLTGKRMLIPAFAALAISLVGGFEGKTNHAVIPIPGDVPTICFGETRGVKMGDYKTDAECNAMFRARLAEFETGMRAKMVAPDKIPDGAYVVFLSVSYNIGLGNFGSSTMLRKINAGDLIGACNELPKWNKAGGRVVKGLTNRRLAERTMCLEALR